MKDRCCDNAPSCDCDAELGIVIDEFFDLEPEDRGDCHEILYRIVWRIWNMNASGRE